MNSVAAVIPSRIDSRGGSRKREWLRPPVSELAHHGECCERARRWLLARSRSAEFSVTDGVDHVAPRWLADRFTWGPTTWPAAWCDVVSAETIDCGVFAAFAREIFRANGTVAYGGQVLRHYDRASLGHYRKKWAAVPGAFDWIDEDEVYHEVCIVRVGGTEVRVYDPTDGVWLDPRVTRGHGSHVALRADVPVALRWGPHTIVRGQWITLDGA
ncbi:MAG: hypothetical protein U0169_02845 [Polyangiaceae bacterium]